MISCIQYHYCLNVTSCHRVICYQLLEQTGKNNFMERNITVISWTWDHLLSRNVQCRLPNRHGVVNHEHESQTEKILLWESKNCKMPDITVFCNYSCSFATDMFGLYCSVNRQDMKLDLVSVFFTVKGVDWGLKCSAIFSLYFACTSL